MHLQVAVLVDTECRSESRAPDDLAIAIGEALVHGLAERKQDITNGVLQVVVLGLLGHS